MFSFVDHNCGYKFIKKNSNLIFKRKSYSDIHTHTKKEEAYTDWFYVKL